MSASTTHRIRAMARAKGRHIASFSEALASNYREANRPKKDPKTGTTTNWRNRRRRDRAVVAAQLAESRVVDQLNAQWCGQLEVELAATITDTTPVKRVSVAQSKSPPGTPHHDPALQEAWGPIASGPRLDDCFSSAKRWEEQDKKDAAIAARPIYIPVWNDKQKAAVIALRPIDARLEVRRREEHAHGVRASLSEMSCSCGKTALELFIKGEHRVARKIRRRRLAWWAR